MRIRAQAASHLLAAKRNRAQAASHLLAAKAT
jgi:hypothetical protein